MTLSSPLAITLAISVAGLFVGPVLVALGRGRALLEAGIDGLMLGVVPALVLMRLVPHVYESLGPAALGLVAFGYAALTLADRTHGKRGAAMGQALLVPALAIHAATDGASLAIGTSTASGPSQPLLAAAVLLHRLPEGLFLATTLVPILGFRRAMGRIGIVALATIFGGVLGDGLLSVLPDAAFDAAVALGLGAMLRLVFHTHSVHHDAPSARAVSGAAFLGGLALTLAIPDPSAVLARAQPRELPMVTSFLALFVETAPWLLGGLWMSALGAVLMTNRQRLPGWRSASVRYPAQVAFVGSVFAAGLSLDSVLLSVGLLGAPLTLTRLLGSAIGAVAIAACLERARADAPPADAPSPPPQRGITLAQALGPRFESIAPWYLVGLLGAALLEAATPAGFAARFAGGADIVLGAALALPLSLGVTAALPIAVVLIHKGFSIAGALSFLIAVPLGSALWSGMQARGGAVVSVARGAMLLGASALCAIATGFVGSRFVPGPSVPDVHPLVFHEHHALEWVAAGVLAAAMLAGLLRRGPRAWAPVTAPVEPHDQHTHDHAPTAEARATKA